jgi:hypothetical protein
MLDTDRVIRISEVVIKILYRRFDNFPEDANRNRNAPFHKAFLNAFSDKLEDFVTNIPYFISLSSWLHGLNTTLGQTFFESVSHILSDGSKREYTSKRSGNLLISQYQKQLISEIITDLSNGNEKPNLEKENRFLFNNKGVADTDSLGFSADVFIEEEDEIIAIELKAVHPNSGEVRGEKQKILEGKAALSRLFPDKEIKFFIGFPFDPTSEGRDTEYNKKRFMSSIINMDKFFDAEEVLLSSELWDYLSGEKNTMEQILSIINSIATTEFMEIYEYINNNDNRNTDKYQQYLRTWNMNRELFLVNNFSKIKEQLDSKYKRIYNQPVFKNGEYNLNRFITLSNLIREVM